MGFFRILIYGIILGVYTSTLIYDIRFMPRMLASQWWMYKLVMLTMINLCLQTAYSIICFLCSVFDWNEELIHSKEIKHAHVPSYWFERRTRLHKICDFMYATSVFPVGMSTCLLFWALYAVDPEFVMPSSMPIPAWLNHVTHTAPLAFILVDTILTCHHAPSRKNGSICIFLFYVAYLMIIFGVRFIEGYWLYPIFYKLSADKIALLLTIAGVLLWFLYLIGDGLNALLWGKAPHYTSDKTPRKIK